MLEEDLSTAGLGLGAAGAAAGLGRPRGRRNARRSCSVGPHRSVVALLPNPLFRRFRCLVCALCVVLLAVGGMMVCDLVRSMGSWNGPYQINSTLMEMVLNLIG